MVVYYRDGRYYDRYVRGWPEMREVVVYERNGRLYREWDDDRDRHDGMTVTTTATITTDTIATGTTDLTVRLPAPDRPDPGRLQPDIPALGGIFA